MPCTESPPATLLRYDTAITLCMISSEDIFTSFTEPYVSWDKVFLDPRGVGDPARRTPNKGGYPSCLYHSVSNTSRNITLQLWLYITPLPTHDTKVDRRWPPYVHSWERFLRWFWRKTLYNVELWGSSLCYWGDQLFSRPATSHGRQTISQSTHKISSLPLLSLSPQPSQTPTTPTADSPLIYSCCCGSSFSFCRRAFPKIGKILVICSPGWKVSELRL